MNSIMSSFNPTGQVQSSESLRRLTIETMSIRYDEAKRQGVAVCTRRAWIDDDLRRLSYPLLGDAEAALLPLD